MGEQSQADRIVMFTKELAELREALAVRASAGEGCTDALLIVESLLEIFGIVSQVGAAAEQLQRHPLLGGLIRQFGLQ